MIYACDDMHIYMSPTRLGKKNTKKINIRLVVLLLLLSL